LDYSRVTSVDAAAILGIIQVLLLTKGEEQEGGEHQSSELQQKRFNQMRHET